MRLVVPAKQRLTTESASPKTSKIWAEWYPCMVEMPILLMIETMPAVTA